MSWRPLNESDEDLRREAQILDAVRDAFGFDDWHKLSPKLYEVDAAMFTRSTGAIEAWIEVKARDRLYDTVLLSVSKALALYRLNLATRLPSYFIIHVPEIGVLLHSIRAVHSYRIACGGNRRGQNGDIEPCIYIEKDAFSLLAPPIDFSFTSEAHRHVVKTESQR